MPSPPVITTSLRGPAGASWLRERGMTVTDPHGLQLYANEIHHASTRITRVWHSSVTADVRIRHEKSSMIFLQIEGVSIIEMDEWNGPKELRPGGFAVFPAGSAFSLRSESEVARYESGFDLEDLPPALRELVASGFIENEPLIGYRQLVVGAASSALSSGLAAAEAGFPHFLRGFTAFLTALLVQSLEKYREHRPRRVVHLYESALLVIEREFRNPDFGVTDLASALGVSLSYLRRIFAPYGTSPKNALREHRLAAASEHLTTDQRGTRISKETIAHLSGFRDARSLRRAFEQHRRRPDSAALRGGDE